MRFLLVMSVLLLVACADTAKPKPKPAPVNDLRAAQAHCLSKGHVRGSYEYDNCYRNTPEMQAYERDGRLSSLAIISKNKAGQYGGRSYPVE